jgi:hypothetical protein
LELQTEYYEKVSEFVRREKLGTRIVDRVLDLWERTLRAVAEDKLALIDTEIDWAIKLKLLDRYAVKHNSASPTPDRAARIWRTTTSADPRVFLLLEQRGLAAASPPTRQSSGPKPCRRRPPGRSSGATSSGRAGGPSRLHRRLGPSEAQRPGAAHGALQGSVRRQ